MIMCIIWKLLVFIILFTKIDGHPTYKKDVEGSLDQAPYKEELLVQPSEKTFPNGTVMGKYAYVDKDGNPVQVKYFADDSSYGVEMNSMKIIQSKDDQAPTDKPNYYNTKGQPQSKEYDILDPFKYPISPISARYRETNDKYAVDDTTKSHYKSKYSRNPEYEVYTQNDVDNPVKRCSADKQKLLVYNLENDARKPRELTFNDDHAPKYCDRF